MLLQYFFSGLFLLLTLNATAQNKSVVVSGPWAGNAQLRNATIWVEVTPEVKAVAVKFTAATNNTNASGLQTGTVFYKGLLGKDFNPIKMELNGLKINTVYNYTLLVNGKAVSFPYTTKFTTKDLWQWRKPAPDFSFLAGSCAYFNEPEFDRPGKPYGGDSSIFETMANTPAAFNIWLGDNWYTREVDFYTTWGMQYRPSHDRATPVLQKFMASMPQYAIWDDHDYGPDNSGKDFIFKKESRRIFMDYSLNPSYGEEDKGIYSVVSYSDVDIFLTDDRFFRSHEDMQDSVAGKPNTAKTYFGTQQMEWLKNALLFSKATFKIIATGSQVLNTYSSAECMKTYSAEYYELLNFLAEYKIKGVLFFSGDRHHSEIIKMERPGLHPLYDVTTSPLTAGVSKVRGNELNNPAREKGTLVEEQNFSKVTVNGKKNERVLTVTFTGIKGNQLAVWSINEKELTTAK